jgi:hypothetical protein
MLRHIQAEVKMNEIYEAVRDSVPWDVTCVRTKHTVSIHCKSPSSSTHTISQHLLLAGQYPYRTVQIVLRLYRSPAEMLAGFDLDATCCAYDGELIALQVTVPTAERGICRQTCLGQSPCHGGHDATMQHR